MSNKPFRPRVEALEARSLLSAGVLDPTFSGDGKQTTNFGSDDRANAVAIQTDGKIVVAGSWDGGSSDFAVARYNPDGSLDATFGGDGKANFTFGSGPFGGAEFATAVAIQDDGKIVVAGHTDAGATANNPNSFAVLRLNTNGSLDTGFSGDGKVIIDFLADDRATDLALQLDGKIVVAGYSGGVDDFAVARLNTNGTLDTNFNFDGKVLVGFPGGEFGTFDRANAVAVQTDGRIVLAGYTDSGSPDNNFAIVRLTATGSLDSSFSGDGKQTIDFGNDDRANDVAIQNDGKIVVVGSWDGGSSDFAVTRLNANGTLDTGFSGDGKANFGFGSGFLLSAEFATAVAIEDGGKIVVAGYTNGGGAANNFAVLRLNATGNLDTSFSGDGKQTIDFGGDDRANDVAVQNDGRIVVVGYTLTGTEGNFAVARLTGLDAVSPQASSSAAVGVQLPDGPGPLIVRIVRVKGRARLDIFDAATGALRLRLFPFGKSYCSKLRVLRRDLTADGSAEVIVLGRQRRRRVLDGRTLADL